MKFRFFYACLALVFISFNANSSGDRKIPGEIMDFAQLGMPFNSHTSEIHNFICVHSEIDSRSGTSSAEFQFDYQMDNRSVINALSGSLAVGVNYPLLQLGAGATIVDSFSDDDFSASWTAHAVAIPDVLRLAPGPTGGYELTEKCSEYVSLYGNDRMNLMRKAGDEFISQINRGASILVQLKLRFATKNQKKEFNAYAKYNSTGLWELDIQGFIDNLSEKEKRSMSVEIKAYQNGGEPASLAAILPNNLMSCAINDISACKNAFEEAIVYVQNFSDQLNDPSNYNVLSYTTSTYLESGLFQLVPSGPSLIAANEVYLQQLETMFKQQLNDRNRAITMLGTYSSYLDTNWIQELKSIKVMTDQNLYMISRVADICYRFPYGDECGSRFTEYNDDLFKVFDRSLLNLPPASATIIFDSIGSSYFVGDQGVYDNDTVTHQFDPDAPVPVYSDNSTIFELNMENAEQCDLTLETSNGSLHIEAFSESATFDLVNAYSKELEQLVFQTGSNSVAANLYCEGLGGDLEVTFPVVVYVPAANVSIDSGLQVKSFAGVLGVYHPNIDKQPLHMDWPTLAIGEQYNVHVDMIYADSCLFSVGEELGGSTQLRMDSGGVIDFSEFYTQDVMLDIRNSNFSENLPIDILCAGVGGDLAVTVSVPVLIPVVESLNVENFSWSILTIPQEFGLYISLNLELNETPEQCVFEINGHREQLTLWREASPGRTAKLGLNDRVYPFSDSIVVEWPTSDKTTGVLTCTDAFGNSDSAIKAFSNYEWDT